MHVWLRKPRTLTRARRNRIICCAARFMQTRAGVVEWQTRVTQNHLRATAWGFDSLLRHPSRRKKGDSCEAVPFVLSSRLRLPAIPSCSLGACALNLADARLKFSAAPVAGLLVSLVHARFLGHAAVHHGLLEALQRGINVLTRLDDDLNQALYHPVSEQIVPPGTVQSQYTSYPPQYAVCEHRIQPDTVWALRLPVYS